MALDKIQASGIGNNVVALHHCDWYSDAGQLDAGGLKLPVGTTAERPTVVAGGREVVTFDLNVTANVPSNDPGFLQNEPWLWTWAANYNGSIFTICFDEGKILCQTREQLINEIEIEVQQDEKYLLLEFFGNFWANLPNSFYQGRSKALRGFELRKNQQLTFRVIKKQKTISTISFQKIKTDLMSAVAVLDYFSCLFCENGGKSPVNCLRNSLLEIKTLLL